MEGRLDATLKDKLVPTIETWHRIGDKVQNEILPRLEKLLERAEGTLDQVSKSARTVEDKTSSVLGTLKNLGLKVDAHLSAGILQDVHEAAQAMKGFMEVQGAPPSSDRALRSLEMRGGNGPAVPQSQMGAR